MVQAFVVCTILPDVLEKKKCIYTHEYADARLHAIIHPVAAATKEQLANSASQDALSAHVPPAAGGSFRCVSWMYSE